MNKCKRCMNLKSCSFWYKEEHYGATEDDFAELVNGNLMVADGEYIECPYFNAKESILEQIKECCNAHLCGAHGCPLRDEYNDECLARNRPDSWDIEEIEKRLADGNKTDNIS